MGPTEIDEEPVLCFWVTANDEELVLCILGPANRLVPRVDYVCGPSEGHGAYLVCMDDLVSVLS